MDDEDIKLVDIKYENPNVKLRMGIDNMNENLYLLSTDMRTLTFRVYDLEKNEWIFDKRDNRGVYQLEGFYSGYQSTKKLDAIEDIFKNTKFSAVINQKLEELTLPYLSGVNGKKRIYHE